MEINEALKTAVSGVSAKTGSTIAATDLVPLYDANNNLTGKIPKSELMNAVKASLPVLLSDQGTAGTKALSLNSSNVLGSMTMANLASVLGAGSNIGFNVGGILSESQIPDNGFCAYQVNYGNDIRPWGQSEQGGFYLYRSGSNSRGVELAIRNDLPVMARYVNDGIKGSWSQLTPASFLNSYSDLASLASALGGVLGISTNIVTGNSLKILHQAHTNDTNCMGYIKLQGEFQGIIAMSQWEGHTNNLFFISKVGENMRIKSIVKEDSSLKVYKDSNNNMYIGANNFQNYFVIGASSSAISTFIKINDTSGYTEITPA